MAIEAANDSPLKRFKALGTSRALTVDHAYSIAYDRLRQAIFAYVMGEVNSTGKMLHLTEEVAIQLENHLLDTMLYDLALAKLLARPQTDI